MIAAMKQAIAHWSRDAAWTRVRPPLVELTSDAAATLIRDLHAAGFEMPSLPAD